MDHPASAMTHRPDDDTNQQRMVGNMSGKFIVFSDERRGFRFDVVSDRGSLVAQSPWCPDKQALVDTIELARECVGTGLVSFNTVPFNTVSFNTVPAR
ncbi:hypothetical protein [Specibacter cremeus]|uniref:hypothetical protein n=1 Tax=Specibacter cremeus TaxID=1629051 RepID=UPI000F7A9E94|nr:hypothetical protein [Specibacter cremeus]